MNTAAHIKYCKIVSNCPHCTQYHGKYYVVTNLQFGKHIPTTSYYFFSSNMLVPSDMIGPQSKLLFQVNKFYGDRVHTRKYTVAKTIREICKVVQDVLKEVEVQEPRFISSLTEINGRYEGLDVVSPHEFEVVLYLNQMGVFNFVDDGSLPGESFVVPNQLE